MIFNTRSGNFYRYDRYTHQIEPIAAPAISKGGRVDVCEEKLQALSFEPIPNITTLPNISTFIIEITRQCNLRCSYCCYSGKYPRNRVHENKSISATQLPLIFDFIEKHRVKVRQLTISFYGGEPLLHKELLYTAVESIKERFPSDAEIVISTNLLNFDVHNDLDWCVKNNITLNVSIDGPEDIHDKHRTNLNGKGSFQEVMHNLSSIKQKNDIYFSSNLNLLVTVSELSSLLPIARFWESNEVICTKEPFSISGISNNFEANTQNNEDELLNTLYELMDNYEHHRHNLFIKSYFEILTSPIIDRPIFDLEESSSALCCLPYNPRCFIDATGQVGICEKTCDELRIGNLHNGFDFEKINQVTVQMAEIKKMRCSTCWMQRFCQLCFTNYFLSDEELLQDCEYQKMWTRISLIIACEMAERNLYDSEEAKLCTLRPLSISDASAVLRIMGDNDVMKYVDGIEPFKTINEAEDLIRLFERNEKNAQSYMLGVEHQENGLIGMIGYDYIDEDEKNANLFFVLDKEFWHKGIMTIMMRELLLSTVRCNNHLPNDTKVEYNRKNNRVETLMSRFNIRNLKVINYDELT